MKMRDAAEVTLSVVGVIHIVNAVLDAPNLVRFFQFYTASSQAGEPYGVSDLLRGAAGFIANLVAGILLVLLARRIADWLTRHCASSADADVELRIVSPEGFRFCLKFVGIIWLIRAVPMLVRWHNPGIAIEGVPVLALALYLIFGGKWLTRFAFGKADAPA
jgi:hypothetical protein